MLIMRGHIHWPMARDRFRTLVSYMGRIVLWLHLGLGSDVWVTARLNDSITVTQV